MKIIKNIKVPTGNILVVQGEKGKLEMLSLGDYGKNINIKCDALGLTRDIEKVDHTDLLPLEEKWVITISTQYTCKSGCTFCDVPRVKSNNINDINATEQDLIRQVLTGIKLHPEVHTSKRLNIHFARMGEPTWNPNVLDATKWMKTHIDPEYRIHPVVSTMMPKNNEWLKTFIHTWMRIKNRLLKGEAGLQLSINSTDDNERNNMFSGNCCTLEEIKNIMEGIIPNGRKITLNFAVADWNINPLILKKYFNPDDYIVKLTPMHKTATAISNNIVTGGDYTTIYPYKKIEEDLKNEGYDVLVFIASDKEDLSMITCGNAILAGKLPPTNLYKEIQ
jgi:23S rRNA (adenine2503-C2)-methyltransferase